MLEKFHGGAPFKYTKKAAALEKGNLSQLNDKNIQETKAAVPDVLQGRFS